MISAKLNSNQEVAAFMSLARMNMIARGHKFELLLRSGRMKRVSYGIKEVEMRDPESRTEEIPEIAFSEGRAQYWSC